LSRGRYRRVRALYTGPPFRTLHAAATPRGRRGRALQHGRRDPAARPREAAHRRTL